MWSPSMQSRLAVFIVLGFTAATRACDQFSALSNEWASLHYTYDHPTPVLAALLKHHPLPDRPSHQALACTMQQLLGPNSTQGRLMRMDNQHVVYEPATCRLRRLSAAAARQCLDSKYIAFVGDSVTRYQYLSLAYFLAHMQHLPRYHGLEKPHLNDKSSWKKGWNQFMLEGSQQLMDDAAPGASVHESCDCWRIESGDTKNGKGFREFRRLCITQHEQQGGRACNNTTKLPPSTLKLGYQQAMGHPTWYEAPLDALRVLLQEQPRPDVVILNVGLWAGTSDGARTENPSTFVLQQYRTLLGNASAMAAQHGVKLVWKTTTARASLSTLLQAVHQAEMTAAQEWHVPIYDVHTLGWRSAQQGRHGKFLYTDGITHPYAFMYQEMNDILLNVLCDDACAWTGDMLQQ